MARRGIYVETVIDGELDEVWALTQDPGEHVRWDARFSQILPVGVTDGQRRAQPIAQTSGATLLWKLRSNGVVQSHDVHGVSGASGSLPVVGRFCGG